MEFSFYFAKTFKRTREKLHFPAANFVSRVKRGSESIDKGTERNFSGTASMFYTHRAISEQNRGEKQLSGRQTRAIKCTRDKLHGKRNETPRWHDTVFQVNSMDSSCILENFRLLRE